jgi:hypothetical protein
MVSSCGKLLPPRKWMRNFADEMFSGRVDKTMGQERVKRILVELLEVHSRTGSYSSRTRRRRFDAAKVVVGAARRHDGRRREQNAGAVVSTTVTVKLQLLLLPAASLARQVTVRGRVGNNEPLAGVQLG